MQTYLILYGADNDYWTCTAESPEHAIEQFQDSETDIHYADINEVYLCIPQLIR